MLDLVTDAGGSVENLLARNTGGLIHGENVGVRRLGRDGSQDGHQRGALLTLQS